MGLRWRYFISTTLVVIATLVSVGWFGGRMLQRTMDAWYDVTIRTAMQHSLAAIEDDSVRAELRGALLKYNQLGALQEPQNRTLQVAWGMLIVFMVFVGGLISWIISRQIMSHVMVFSAFAERVAKGDFSRMPPQAGVSELTPLSDAFSRMIRGLQKAAAELAHAERRAAWQHIARAIAHEIKNPLTPMRLNTERLRERFHDNPERFKATFMRSTDMVLSEIQRLERLANEFSTFAKLPAPNLKPMDLHELVRHVISLYEHPVEQGILTASLPDSPVMVMGDHDQIEQAVLNLVKNALEAIEGDGQVVVTLTVDIEAIITVEDDGPGVPPDRIKDLFQPYMSTKPDGSGIGLAMVERIIVDHSGSVSAENIQPHGARFSIQIPVPEEDGSNTERGLTT
jgi:two-component system, NtrC family, nitrogen regulation sensor histidine kinase NtrY